MDIIYCKFQLNFNRKVTVQLYWKGRNQSNLPQSVTNIYLFVCYSLIGVYPRHLTKYDHLTISKNSLFFPLFSFPCSLYFFFIYFLKQIFLKMVCLSGSCPPKIRAQLPQSCFSCCRHTIPSPLYFVPRVIPFCLNSFFSFKSIINY